MIEDLRQGEVMFFRSKQFPWKQLSFSSFIKINSKAYDILLVKCLLSFCCLVHFFFFQYWWVLFNNSFLGWTVIRVAFQIPGQGETYRHGNRTRETAPEEEGWRHGWGPGRRVLHPATGRWTVHPPAGRLRDAGD